MYVASLSCQEDLNHFFKHENQEIPPSLSGNGQLREGTQSDLLECLEQCSSPSKDNPHVDAIVFDGATPIHVLKPVVSRLGKLSAC